MATNEPATVEKPFEATSFMWPVLRRYNEGQLGKPTGQRLVRGQSRWLVASLELH
jgi:hypothetical protein